MVTFPNNPCEDLGIWYSSGWSIRSHLWRALPHEGCTWTAASSSSSYRLFIPHSQLFNSGNRYKSRDAKSGKLVQKCLLPLSSFIVNDGLPVFKSPTTFTHITTTQKDFLMHYIIIWWISCFTITSCSKKVDNSV